MEIIFVYKLRLFLILIMVMICKMKEKIEWVRVLIFEELRGEKECILV